MVTPEDEPSHPGEVLVKVLAAMGMSQLELSRRTGLSAKHINQICRGHAGISASSAVLLEEVVGHIVEAETWMWFQGRYDVARAREARRALNGAGLVRDQAWIEKVAPTWLSEGDQGGPRTGA